MHTSRQSELKLAKKQGNLYQQWIEDLNLNTADFRGYRIPRLNSKMWDPLKASRVRRFNPLALSPEPKMAWQRTKLPKKSTLHPYYAPNRPSKPQTGDFDLDISSSIRLCSDQVTIGSYANRFAPPHYKPMKHVKEIASSRTTATFSLHSTLDTSRDPIAGGSTPVYVISPGCGELADPDDLDILIITVDKDDVLPLPPPITSGVRLRYRLFS